MEGGLWKVSSGFCEEDMSKLRLGRLTEGQHVNSWGIMLTFEQCGS